MYSARKAGSEVENNEEYYFQSKLEFADLWRLIMKLFGIFGLAILIAVVSAPIAKADGVDTFTYKSDGNTFVWQLPVSPTPTNGDVYPGWGFTLENVPVSVNGASTILGSFDFYSTYCAGGFDLAFGNNVPADAYGPMLYTGWEGAPTFLTGTFRFTDYGMSDDGLRGTLVITNVPEPSSIGFLTIGFMIVVFGFTCKRVNGCAARLQRV